MDWSEYLRALIQQRMAETQALSSFGPSMTPSLPIALQRFLMMNTPAIWNARKAAEIAQQVVSEQAPIQAQVLGNIPLLGGITGQVASDQMMADAQAMGNAMIADASGNPSWTQETIPNASGWGPLRTAIEGN